MAHVMWNNTFQLPKQRNLNSSKKPVTHLTEQHKKRKKNRKNKKENRKKGKGKYRRKRESYNDTRVITINY